MTLPTFLLIGAMKAGTTSLHDALVLHPDVYMPPNKEPDSLVDLAIESPDGLAAYEEMFRRGASFTARGEASTSYTKRHLHDGVAERTRRLLGAELALIFVARDPIDRIVSHVNHERLSGRGFDQHQAIDLGSKFVENSRYAFQLEPWVEAFGRDRLLMVDFRQLIAEPEMVLDQSYRHLGVDPSKGPNALVQSNAASSARIESALLQRVITKATWYEATVKNWVPSQVRRGLRNRLVREVDLPPLSRNDLSLTPEVLTVLEQDRRQLAELTGLELHPLS